MGSRLERIDALRRRRLERACTIRATASALATAATRSTSCVLLVCARIHAASSSRTAAPPGGGTSSRTTAAPSASSRWA